MPITYLKQAHPPVQAIDTATTETVRGMLSAIESGGEEAVRRCARDLDGYTGEIVLGGAAFAEAERALSPGVKDDIRFARDRVQDFARRQRDSMQEFRSELLPGLEVGQRLIPCHTAGCRVRSRPCPSRRAARPTPPGATMPRWCCAARAKRSSRSATATPASTCR